jgi:hypothetical protein
MAFRDIGRHGHCGAGELRDKPIELRVREPVAELIDQHYQIHGFLPDYEVAV